MKIWAWGANTNGQLGLGYTSEQVSSPTSVNLKSKEDIPVDAKPVSVQGGASRTLVLAENLPKNVDVCGVFHIFRHPKFKEISCGWDFNLFLDSDSNQIYSAGDNTFGQLGRITLNPVNGVPIKVSNEWKPTGSVGEVIKFSQIAAGMRHAAGIRQDNGNLYVWGDNSKNQLGLENPNNASRVVGIPTPVLNHEGLSFIKVRCGKSFTLALDENGIFFGCGLNKFGQLCHAPQDFGNFTRFVPILERSGVFTDDVEDFRCGWSHVLVLLKNGKVLSWGRNNFGQLGRTSVNPDYDVEPNYVEIFEPVLNISCGSEHNLALGKSGTVYAWGWNEHDNCGIAECDRVNLEKDTAKDSIPLPTEVRFPEKVSVAVIGCGAGNSFAITD